MDIGKKITQALEIPPEACMGIPKITVVGNERVCVENYTSLLDYKNDSVRLKYKDGVIEILGESLEIKVIGEENIVLCGKVFSVKLI